MTVTHYVRRMSEGPLETRIVGTKAGTLMHLSVAGFPVPQGFVVPTGALRRALETVGIGPDDPGSVHSIRSLPFPDDLSAEIDVVAAECVGTPLAVRSSAVDEDLGDRSYAGQYASMLHVVGSAELGRAIRECWSSAFGGGVRSYAGDSGSSPGTLAVLIQPMVRADAAGVAFSADPLSGDRARARISAVRGLGDRLAEGSATPDEWYVDGEAVHESGAEDAITAEQAHSIAALVREVAENRGAPQDIEWAVSQGELWLLQARPITALAAEPGAAGSPEQAASSRKTATGVPEGFWRRSTAVTRPLSPMHRSLVLPILNHAVGRMFEHVMAGGVQFRAIGGWQYSSFQPLADQDVADRIARIVAADESDAPMTTVRRWYDRWEPDVRRRLREYRESEARDLLDDELLRRFRELREFATETAETHFSLVGAQQFVLGELGVSCRDLLGWGVSGVLDLVAGQSGKTTEPGRRLTELAQLAADDDRVVELIAESRAAGVEDLARESRKFAEKFAEYLRECGQRMTGSDIDEVTPAERPALVLRLIAGRLGEPGTVDGTDPRRQRELALERAHSLLAQQPRQRRDDFDSAVERARTAYPTRDDTKFYHDAALALLRYCLLEIGARLVDRDQLSVADDVFLLESDEPAGALSRSESLKDRVAARRREWDRAYAAPGPKHYGKPPKPPGGGDSSPESPPNVRATLDKAMWAFGALRGDTATAETETYLTGTPASRGRYTGPVRVLRGESDFDKLRSGDVLVCPETSAQWSMLFPHVRALITDTGGMLSHPAIIAREYGIPAVLATGEATHHLEDGVLVVVDGDRGTVDLA